MRELGLRTTLPHSFETFKAADFKEHGVEIYEKGRKYFPDLPTDVTGEIDNRVKSLYRKTAFATFVRHEKSLPTFRGGMHHCSSRSLRFGWYDPRSDAKKISNKEGHGHIPLHRRGCTHHPLSQGAGSPPQGHLHPEDSVRTRRGSREALTRPSTEELRQTGTVACRVQRAEDSGRTRKRHHVHSGR